jgi:hypothetical protein
LRDARYCPAFSLFPLHRERRLLLSSIFTWRTPGRRTMVGGKAPQRCPCRVLRPRLVASWMAACDPPCRPVRKKVRCARVSVHSRYFGDVCEARAEALGRRFCVAGRTLTQPSPSRSLDSTFRALQDLLEGRANFLQPPPERLVYRVAYL